MSIHVSFLFISTITKLSDLSVFIFLIVIKEASSKAIVRKFHKETSVFAMWKEDTAKSIQQAFTIDWENTKISKLIKDSVDLMKTREFMA